ncbi:hypothetical protein BDV93DRAFT_558792 [Ceratobasidium sp. AG-I]|nr:hypothetical protein BDV93DRAFT_558792 [Ceratobasidium sp. AG-I]
MRRIGEVLPLPGLLELEGIIRGLIRRSKELKYEENKQASIAARLESLIDCAKRLPDLSELSSQLDDIKSQLEELLKFNPRFRITQAQRKFAAWEKLDRQIDRAVELTLLRLAAVPRNALVELNTVLPREAKVPVSCR